jgi:hypothetical protein
MKVTWFRGFERWRYVWGGYWANFSLTCLILMILGYLMYALFRFCTDNTFTHNTIILKVLLGVIVFLILCYGFLVIITLAGEVAIGAFCTVLREVNMGNSTMLDQLPAKYTVYSKIILKECTQGLNGRLEKYFPVYATTTNTVANGFVPEFYN